MHSCIEILPPSQSVKVLGSAPTAYSANKYHIRLSAPRSAQALDEVLQAVRELIAHPLAKRTQIVDGMAATLTSRVIPWHVD